MLSCNQLRSPLLQMTFRTCWLTLIVCITSLFAQNRGLDRNTGHRVILVVPIIGAGTYADPKRPALIPAPKDDVRNGLIRSFSWERSDDGNFAIVELVGKDPQALQGFLADVRVVKAFENGKSKRGDIETEIRKFKKNFSLGPEVRR